VGVGDEVDLVAAAGQLESELRGHHARSAVDGVAGDPDFQCAARHCPTTSSLSSSIGRVPSSQVAPRQLVAEPRELPPRVAPRAPPDPVHRPGQVDLAAQEAATSGTRWRSSPGRPGCGRVPGGFGPRRPAPASNHGLHAVIDPPEEERPWKIEHEDGGVEGCFARWGVSVPPGQGRPVRSATSRARRTRCRPPPSAEPVGRGRIEGVEPAGQLAGREALQVRVQPRAGRPPGAAPEQGVGEGADEEAGATHQQRDAPPAADLRDPASGIPGEAAGAVPVRRGPRGPGRGGHAHGRRGVALAVPMSMPR
jgi:hypothetical protein